MELERKNLLGEIIGVPVNIKTMTIKQGVKAIPCFGNDAKNVNQQWNPVYESGLVKEITFLDEKKVPILEVELSEIRYCLYDSSEIYIWYIFKKKEEYFNILKSYSNTDELHYNTVFGINTEKGETTKYYVYKFGSKQEKDKRFFKSYKISSGLKYNDVVKCVALFCVKQGVEKNKIVSDERLSDVETDVCNEYLKPKQEPSSSYRWETVKCNYEQDGKKYNKIVNIDFGKLWDDIDGGIFGLGNADIKYSDSYAKYSGTKELLGEAKKIINDERQAGDELFEVAIALKDNEKAFKGLGINNKNLQIDILNSLKNGDVKKLIERLPNRNIGTITRKKGTIFYEELGIKKYSDAMIDFDRLEGTNVDNILKVFGVPLKKEYLKGEGASFVIDYADSKSDRIVKGYGYVFSNTSKQVDFKSNCKENLNLLFKDIFKQKCEKFAEILNRDFRKVAVRIYGTQGKTYLAGTNMENAGVVEFLNVVLLMMLVTDNSFMSNSICDSLLKSGINKDTSAEEISSVFRSVLTNKINDKYKNSEKILKPFDFNIVTKNNVAGMLLNEVEKIKGNNDNIKKQKNLKNIVFTCICKARRRIKIYSLSKKFNKDCVKDYRFATIVPYNEPLQDISEDDYDKLNIQQVEDFIQTWMVKPIKSTNKKPKPVPIEGYYDMLNGMTPYVEYSFRQSCNSMEKIINNEKEYIIIKNDKKETINKYIKKSDGNYYIIINNKEETGNKAYSYKDICRSLVNSFSKFDTIQYPYFKNLHIEDKGVKKITLTLFDPDFGSFNLDRNGNVFSLEAIIRGALRNPYFEKTDKEDNSYYDASIDYSSGIDSGYLDIKEGASELSPTNLKIRFGYTKYDNIVKTDKRFNEAFNERFAGTSKKNARWWDEEQVGSTTNINLDKIKKYIKDGEIQNQEAGWVSIKKLGIEDNNVDNPYNELGGDLSVNSMLNSPYQTTVLSREYNFMIIGFNTEFTQSGIQYTIQAVESKDAVTLKTRFLQRYAELTANPEEVLYNLMHIFNEDNDGKNIEKSKIKLCLVEDVDDKYMKDVLNMKYDFKKMKNEKMFDGGIEVEDLYSAACFEKGITYNPKYLKDITLKFGSEEAIKNYNSNRDKNNPPLYKTVAQLMNEFCANCPPKVEKKWKNVKDENGQSIISDNGNCAARPLKWFAAEDTKNEIVYICLYYRRTKKVERIRVYTWGPHNPTNSCVKSINLKNANEFAILSAVDAFKTGDGIIPRDTCMSAAGIADIDTSERKEISPIGYNARQVSIAGDKADEYLNAFSSSMYNVSMGILGDPSLCFDGELQPFTYPIELNLLMPQNEFTRRVLAGEKSSEYGEVLNNIINEKMSRFKTWYSGSAFYKDYKNPNAGMKESTEKNQILHEASGFYVISKITHDISRDGFNTNLDLVSYPNIAADVIGGVREKWENGAKNKS